MEAKKQRAVRIEQPLWDRCKARAKAEGIEVSEWVRHVLRMECHLRDPNRTREYCEGLGFKPLNAVEGKEGKNA